jgi:hypothetical protein
MAFNQREIRDMYRAELAEKAERVRDPFPNDKPTPQRQPVQQLRAGRPRPAAYGRKGSTKR